jgi:hypothetical protein
MLDQAQVERTGNGYRIITPYTSEQLTMIYNFLAPEPKGRGYFDNFVINNSHHSTYWQLSASAQIEDMITEPLLFDLWYLMTMTLVEVCGCNRNWILFEKDTPKSTELIDFNSVELNKQTFDQMASQLIEIIHRVNNDIPVISNNVVLTNGPRVVS